MKLNSFLFNWPRCLLYILLSGIMIVAAYYDFSGIMPENKFVSDGIA